MTTALFALRPIGAWISFVHRHRTVVGQVVLPPGGRVPGIIDTDGVWWGVHRRTPTETVADTAVTTAMRETVARAIQQRIEASAAKRDSARRWSPGDIAVFGDRSGRDLVGRVVRVQVSTVDVDVAGVRWRVDGNLLRPAAPGQEPAAPTAPSLAGAPSPAATHASMAPAGPPVLDVARAGEPFYRRGIEGHLLAALAGVLHALSPENLTADGERPRSQVRRLQADLERQRRGIVHALGYEPEEGNLFDFMQARHQADGVDPRHAG